MSITVMSTTTMPDESQILKQIVANHAPDNIALDVNSLFVIVKDVIDRSNLVADGVVKGTQVNIESGDVKISEGFNPPSDIISKLSCEIGCNSSQGVDETTKSVLKTLSSYSWDAKVVLSLAALALKYGELWFLAQVHPSYQFAKSMAILKQVPTLMNPSGPQRERLITLNTLIKNVTQVTESIVKLEKISSKNTVKEVPQLSTVMAHIPVDVYSTIQTIVICASQIPTLITKSQEYPTQELSPIASQVNKTLSRLNHELSEINIHLGETKRYKMIVKLIEVSHSDNVEVIKALIVTRDDMLIHGTTKKQIKINDLRGKRVLLFISGIDITTDDFSVLTQITENCKPTTQGEDSPFEVVWIPVVEKWTDDLKEKFENLQSKMPWYTVQHPSAVNGAAIWFIKDHWHFNYKPMVVVLDPRGKVESENAFPMMMLWGKEAFPFTEEKEKMLWKEKSWVEVVGSSISPELEKPIKVGELILWYGGNDEKLVQEIQKQTNVIKDSGVSVTAINVNKSTSFWPNVENTLVSVSKNTTESSENYKVMQDLQKLLHYKNEGTWTMMSKGSQVETIVDGSVAADTLNKYDTWKDKAKNEGLDVQFININKEKHPQLSHDPRDCFLLSYPSGTGKIPENVMCPKCSHVTEKLVTFQCCHIDGNVAKPTQNRT